MTDRKTMYDALTCAAWGYFLLFFDFKLGNVSVLPAFAGYLLLREAARDLSAERRDLSLLRPLLTLLAVWAFGDWLLSWAGQDMDGHVLFADLLMAAIQLYFHFQFLTDMAALAERHQAEGGDLHRRLLRKRTLYTLLITFVAIVQQAYGGFADPDAAGWLVMVPAIFACVLSLGAMVNLFELRDCFRAEGEEEQHLSV